MKPSYIAGQNSKDKLKLKNMQYYKVPKKLSDYAVLNNKKEVSSTLVTNELLTVKEAEKRGVKTVLNEHAELLEISKNKTFFFFGARFQERTPEERHERRQQNHTQESRTPYKE